MKKVIVINEQYESSLSRLIQQEYNKLISVVSEVSVNFRTIKEIDATGGKVSISALIAYQICWGKLLT